MGQRRAACRGRCKGGGLIGQELGSWPGVSFLSPQKTPKVTYFKSLFSHMVEDVSGHGCLAPLV